MNKYINKLLKKLENNGYEVYLIGGYTRDFLIGIETFDIDICTNALPKDVIRIFKLNTEIQDNYGSIKIKTKKYNIDITTFRKENNYQNRKPKTIIYVNDLKADLKRRDFTINSIAMDSKGKILDYYNGRKDIENKIIKCIGSIKEKLTEDPLRMLRAIRFATIYDFNIDSDIKKFIIENKDLLNKLSFNRKKEELDKILSSKNRIKGLKLLYDLNLFNILEINSKIKDIKDCNDILGMYAELNISENYPLNKNEREIIKKIRELLKLQYINNKTLYKYGLYINIVVGEILGVNTLEINKLYKKLPIKTRKDIKISSNDIVKIKNNCYNKINQIYEDLEEKILSKEIKNNSKAIVKYLRK